MGEIVSNKSRGIALIEFAVTLPIFLLMFVLFWDLAVDRISELRHQAAATQMSLVFKAPAVKVSIPIQGGVPTVTMSGLSVSELRDPDTGFLWKLNDLFNDIMDNVGSGASAVVHNAAAELWYFNICDDTSGCASRGVPFGAVTSQDVAGAPSNRQRFFTSPGPTIEGRRERDACFSDYEGGYSAATTAFDSYTSSQIAKITDPANYSIPFGTKLVDVPGVGNIAAVQTYAQIKPVLFLAFCSKAPKFFNRLPHITYLTLFLDKEIGYVPASSSGGGGGGVGGGGGIGNPGGGGRP